MLDAVASFPEATPQTSKSETLYRRAKEIIPGGTQLLSKRPEMFAPECWPAYYKSAKGCQVTDLDGRTYRDFTTMGIGSCLLGYAHEAVNDAVLGAVRSGSMSTLNCPKEVALAEVLLEINGWADRVRFTRTGGEAMTVAVRIARAATGRNKIAFCGYHGWHDWYLAANLGGLGALDGQLLPGLDAAGVPSQLAGTVYGFHYNQLDELERLVAEHGPEIAAIVMEPMRMVSPQDGFLRRVAEIAKRNGIVLVFDEITTGWRYVLGGVHQEFGVNPDMAVFAKGMSNGYPMAAIVGVESVMESAQKTFISSTYWTEAIGPAAALATIDSLEKEDVWTTISAASRQVANSFRMASAHSGLPIAVQETAAMVTFRFDLGPESNAARTLYTKLMLDKGILAAGAFYATAAHTTDDVEVFADAMDEVFCQMADLRKNESFLQALETPEAQSGFQRLT